MTSSSVPSQADTFRDAKRRLERAVAVVEGREASPIPQPDDVFADFDDGVDLVGWE